MKKICSALLAFAMILGLTATITFAESNSTPVSITNTVTANDAYVDIPAMTITYTVNKGTASTDGGKVIYAGVGMDNVEVTETYSKTTERTSSAVATINFSIGLFNAPGIYRYTVQASSCSNTDVTLDSSVKTLDVYVINGTSGLEIAAIVMTGLENETETGKVEGFNHTYTKATYTLTVTNTVTGNQGDKNKDFTYNLSITSGNTLTAVIKVKAATQGGEDTTKATVSLTSNTEFKLKDGEYLVVTGLCDGDKATVTQTDESADGYTTTVKVNDAEKEENPLTSGELTISANATIDFTNTKNITTPTGVVLSIAPYVAMVGLAGVFFVLVVGRRRESEEL